MRIVEEIIPKILWIVGFPLRCVLFALLFIVIKMIEGPYNYQANQFLEEQRKEWFGAAS